MAVKIKFVTIFCFSDLVNIVISDSAYVGLMCGTVRNLSVLSENNKSYMIGGRKRDAPR